MTPSTLAPVSKRIVVLDALRGFALMGIAMANFPEFSLYSFLPAETAAAMPSAATDSMVRWLLLFFVDGKFYTIFSILFGIGFSIILRNAESKGLGGNRLFYRRMVGLTLIGLLHLLLLWSGDILLLYALMGMLLPPFMRLSDRAVKRWIAAFLALPVVCDLLFFLLHTDPAAAVYDAWWTAAAAQGITEENFATFLRDANGYSDVSAFLMQGAVERMWEFVDSSRYFKVLGLFLAGAYLGRKGLLSAESPASSATRATLRRWAVRCLAIGVPMSVVYTLVGMGVIEAEKPLRSLVYCLSVYPMGFAYFALIVLAYLRSRDARLWQWLAAPGRMALSCYLLQSVAGIVLFYGIGFGLGDSFGLAASVGTALAVFLFEVVVCRLWMRRFAYGPVEWLWRMWNYGRRLPLTRK